MAQDKYSQNRQLAYDLLKQEGYTDIGDSAEELFKNKANSELAYQLLSQAGYTDIGKDYNEFASMLYGPQQPSRPTAETEQVEEVEQPAKPARQIDQAAAAEGRQAFQNAIASRSEVSTKEDIPQATQKYMAENPVEGGQRDYQRTQLVDQLNEAKKVGEPIIADYEKRLQEYNDSEKELVGEGNVEPWLQSTAERKAWLDEHRQEYNDARESIQMAEARLNYYDKPRVVEEIDAQIAKNQKHVAPKAISTTGTGYFPTQGAGYNMEESHNYEAANEILGMAKQTYQQGSKADPGYEGNGLEQVWTAARQFVEGGINNVDMGSLTYGLSEGSALIQARRVGDKYNKAIEKAGISEDDDMETAYQKAEKAYDSLTDGEKALLEALVEYSDAQIARQNDVSVASAAGAGAEQSAEFMLDFILTGGLEAVGKKAVGKLLRRQLGKKVKFGEQVLSDVATSALRTAVMLPRNLAAYGENLTQIDWEAVEKGTNEGKIPFARSHMNAALNTALTQYIEYWSEGFGEYFAAGEKKLFQAVTKKAPKTAIGKTLTQYRGSIGQFLDHGKFNGQFNEMLEEVVGSLFNSTAGWLSGDRVGDSDAIKEFWSGENLATLFFSFLPMTAISTRTNIKAYNTMKEHYDNGVKVLNPFIENGAISQEDLNGLVSDIENKTPEEIVSKIEDITDKARKANGGFLPQNFAQALMGYCEGTFAMGMRNDAWEDSAEKMGVVNAYSQFYANPDERAAYDLSQAEQQAHDAAIQQGYSEEDLDQDAYILAQQALANEDPVLQQYAETKAAMSGLRDGFQKDTEAQIAERENRYFNNVAVEKGGKYIMTRAYLNTPDALVGVFVVSPDITVNVDGTISTPTGADGLVQYRKAPGYPIETAKASEFSDASTEDFNDWADRDAESFSSARNESFEQALNTISPLAKAEALYQMQGQNVIIEGSGAYEPVRVERLTHGGENVVISGDRDVLQGVAMAAGINSPGGTRLEIPVENIWDMLAKENDGSLSTEAPQGQPQQSSTTAAPQSDATRPVSGGATLDGRPIGDIRIDEGNNEATFTYQDDPDRILQTMDLGEFRQKTGQAQASNAPAAPTAEVPEAPVAETPAAEEPQSKIPVDKDGNKIYDAPGVEPIDAYEDMYSTEGLSEADVDEWVISQSDEAEKNRNPKIKKGQSLQEWGKEKAEANRKADFWKELRDVAEEHIREREEAAKREADLQAQIEKYGVDTRGFDLTPQTTEEAVAEYLGNSENLIDLEDAKKETLGKSKSGRIPVELFRHLGNGGILTSKGGRTIQDVANDIVGEYESTLAITQDEVRDIIIDYLTRYTKSEMREMIFNNRLQAALAELEQQNGTSAEVEEDLPAAEEETIPAEEAVEEAPEGTEVPEEAPVAEPEPAEPETATEEEEDIPSAETETVGQSGAETAPESEGVTSETPENSVPSQEEGTKESGAKEDTSYGSNNKVVSKDRYEELKKKMLAKIKGQANAGFDPEIFAMGVEMAAYHIEAGARKFVDFAKRMINDLTDAIRPYLKGIYNGARDLPGMEDYRDEMDSADYVSGIDINQDFNSISDENSGNSLREEGGRDTDTVPGSPEGGVGETEGEGGSAVPDGEDSGQDTGTGGDADVPGNVGEGQTAGGENDEANSKGDKRRGGRKAGGSVDRGGQRGRSDDGRRGGKRTGESVSEPAGDTESGVQEVLEGESEPAVEGVKKIVDANTAGEEAQKAKEESIKDETNTAKLEAEKDAIKEKLSGLEITDETAVERAILSGELEAVLGRLRKLYADAPSQMEQLQQEKVPYVSVADPSGEHCIGSVVPAIAATAMHEAAQRVESEVGKPLAEFVMEELGYQSLDEMFTKDGKDIGLAAEQVDAAALAIYQMKSGKSFIDGDMTGIGKGRVGAALIRWAKLHGKKCIFVTQSPGLFSDMYRDLTDIGSGELLPFIVNDKDPGNKNKSTVILNGDKEVVVKTPAPRVKHALWESSGDTLPTVTGKGGPANGPQRKGKTYDFLMMTYSQAQSTRGKWAKMKLDWIKKYAKDAIVIMDESHLAAGDSGRGDYFQDLSKLSGGTTFMSATFAKRPENMGLYAVKSSMGDARVSNQALIETIESFGIPMQEYLASALYRTGEMVRRERDFTDVKTQWLDPKVSYTEAEYNSYRNTNDKTIGLVRAIIAFQRAYIEPMIEEMNKTLSAQNKMAHDMGEGWFYSYTNTPYSSQVSNVCNLLFYAMKAKKAADIAIEKMKNGEKAVIVVDNTLEGYINQLTEAVERPDFTAIFEKAVKSILKYRFNKKWMVLDREASEEAGKEVWVEDEEKREVTEIPSIRGDFDETAELAYKLLLSEVEAFSGDKSLAHLSLSPIDYIKELIADAGFSCGEITGRKVELVKREDGLYEKANRDDERKDAENRFNGGTAKKPLPQHEQFDALIINSAGSTGISLHSSRRFGNRAKRNMIIVQPAKDPNVEVQTRGRTDRTGQVFRSDYYYITSPIPAEYKIVMMLRKKLASLDAQSVGTENVSSNKVDADDMDNKYGDEVAKDFLGEHPEINHQLDKPISQTKDKASNEMVWKGRDGLLYDLLIGMQRMTCEEQELIINSLQESYIELIEYHTQNNSNELSSTTLNLEAVTVDEGVFIHGKDDKSISVFAHDSKLERVQVNVLKKPLRSQQIYVKMNQLGAITEDGKIDPLYGAKIDAAVSAYIRDAKSKLREKQEEELNALKESIRAAKPDLTEGDIDKEVSVVDMMDKQKNERDNNDELLESQRVKVEFATYQLHPGAIVMVPLVDGNPEQVPYGFGRFIGFKTAKDGKPTGVKAVFAVKDSRSVIEIPVVKMRDVIKGIVRNTANSSNLFSNDIRDIGGYHEDTWITDEDRRQARDEWWDSRTPQKSRTTAYMITGNLLQAGDVLKKYKGTMCVYTRKDAETGRISVDTGMLLAPNFDPENFHVGEIVTKDYLWNTGNAVHNNEVGISVRREGDNMVVEFSKRKNEKLSNHPVLKDETIKGMMIEDDFTRSKDSLSCTIAEKDVNKALDYLFREYGFTRDTLFIMPDSTERVDAIIPDPRPFKEIIIELSEKYPHVYSVSSASNALKRAMTNYKLDVDNEELIQQIKDLVALRQAFIREDYSRKNTEDLVWDALVQEGDFEANKDDKDVRDRAYANLLAIKDEVASRVGAKGTLEHYKQGRKELSEIENTFNRFNKDKKNAEIAKKLFARFKRVKGITIPIVYNERIENRTGGFSQGQVVQYNWKYMNSDWILDQMKANVLLHELTHTFTVYAHDALKWGYEHLLPGDMPAVVRELEQIYKQINFDEALRTASGDGYYYDYGNKNWEEMLAETASNPTFREHLSKIQLVKSTRDGDVTFTKVRPGQDTTGKKVITALDAIMDRLMSLIEDFSESAIAEVYRGSRYGEALYRESTGVERAITAAELESANTTLDRMSEELGIKVNKVGRSEMPKGHETDKGFYDTKTGEMTICMDNVTDERDAIATVLHETVGHHGLRQLFGDRFNDAMVRIYAALDANGKRWVNSYIARHPNADNIRAVEEYLSHLAESGNFKNTVWDKIKEIFGKIVDALFGTDGFLLTDNELNYILRASYEHLKNPDWLNTVQGKAFDTLLKRRLGINETDPNKPTDPQGPDAGRLYRDGDTGVANDDYNSLVDSWENKMLTENQDADRPVRIGMDKVMKEKGIKSISEDEDYVQRHNLASSRAESQAHEFELFKFSPLMDQVRAIQSRILAGTKATKATRQAAYERILDYMYAVSGLERNNYKNAEIEAEKQNALAGVTDAAERAKIEKEYEAKKRDWSGITSLMGTSPANWKAAEAQARAMIANFEKAIGNKGMLDELWNRVRACTDYSLEHAYKYGLLTREEFERLHGTASQPRMWNYYLPLRGFSEMTAEEQFSYANFTNPSRNSAVVKKMNGRWTQADNPLANILNIAETEIVQGNDNWAKQALYRFTLNAGDNTLLSASEPWYVKNPATGKWSLAFPDPGETLEEFEARMKALRALDDPLAKKGRQGLKLDNIMVNKAHRNEHAIHLKVGGIDKMIWVNGDPALARAVSGIGRAQNLQWLRRAGRVLSNLFTTYSLDFTAKNLIRDTTYSFIALHIKEDKAYRHQYYKNWIKNFGYGAFAYPMISLAAQWENGKLVQKEQNGTLTPRERDFLNFMRDGGQTGYTIINSVSQIKKDLEKQMRSAGGKPGTIPVFGHYAKAVKTLNEAFELLTRFTAYQTSRDMGRSGQRAASDAKEISVNFNRRGAQSGNGIWGNIAAYLGATHYFYNAGVQGFDNFLGLFKKKPGKMSAITAGFVMMGILTPLINSMLAGLIGGGDGDDDWYWNLPEWVRRNNLIIGTGKWYFAFPLPVEFRAPYGIGDIAGSAFCYEKYPNRHFGNVAGDILSTAAGILPVNPVEGYSGNGNLGDAALRAVAPDAGMFFVDWATNRDYTGRPLWKENPFSDTVPKSQGAYASTPKGIVAACQKLAEVSNGEIDIAPGLVRDFLQNYGGGFFRAAEDVSKIITGIRGKDPERPLRWDNVPFFSGFTGHIDEDRSNSFATNALYDYKKLSEDNVKSMNAILNTNDVSASILYDNPETLYERDGVTIVQKAKIKRMLDSKEYKIGKEYRKGMNLRPTGRYEYEVTKSGTLRKKEIKEPGVDRLRQDWKEARDRWASLPDKTEEQKRIKADAYKDVTNAWHLYYDAQGDLAVKLMNIEYNKEQ